MEDDHINIGYRRVWGGTQPFGLSVRDRRQHAYVIGQTGAGKTTLLRNLILQDIEAGRGVGVIDPHGDLAEELLDHIPPWRSDHVVYFNPSDREHPACFNVLRTVLQERRPLVASGIVAAFHNLWRDSWGPRLEYILYASVAALLDVENATLLGIPRMLTDPHYRRWVVEQIKDPVVRGYWSIEFEGYDKRLLSEAISPIQNKVGQLLMAPDIRNILGQIKSKIDPAFMMDRNRIFIANLSKGLLGEDKSNLLGSLLVTAFQTSVMGRASQLEEDRRDFYLYVDEFQNFATDSFASILSEARKYRLCLTLSHQYTAQLTDRVRDAVFGNAGTLISFRVGENDGILLERAFGAGYRSDTFTGLGNYEVCVKLPQGGVSHEPFLGTTLKPWGRRYGRRDKLLHLSRQKYTARRAVVENKINRWMTR